MKKFFLILLIMFSICFISGCDNRPTETKSYTLKIVDKIIDEERGDHSETNYYFVLEEFGMVSVSYNEYHSYMIGDMYEYTFTVRVDE